MTYDELEAIADRIRDQWRKEYHMEIEKGNSDDAIAKRIRDQWRKEYQFQKMTRRKLH